MVDLLQDEIEILDRLSQNDQLRSSELNVDLVRSLAKQRLVSTHSRFDGPADSRSIVCYVRITGLGLAALREHQLALEQRLKEQREQAAQEEARRHHDDARAREQNRKDRHHDYFVAAFQILLGIILGIMAEHYGQVVAFIKELFH